MWEVKADPRSGIKDGCPVVAIVAILLPHTGAVQGASLPLPVAQAAHRGSKNINTLPSTTSASTASGGGGGSGGGLKCGIVAIDSAGVVTLWDLAVLVPKSFGSKSGPSCLLRLCLYDHPAVLFQLPTYGYDNGYSYDNGPSSKATPPSPSTGSTVIGLCPFPRSTEPESGIVPKGLTGSKDNDVLCVTFSNGRVMLLDLLKRRIGETSSMHVFCDVFSYHACTAHTKIVNILHFLFLFLLLFLLLFLFLFLYLFLFLSFSLLSPCILGANLSSIGGGCHCTHSHRSESFKRAAGTGGGGSGREGNGIESDWCVCGHGSVDWSRQSVCSSNSSSSSSSISSSISNIIIPDLISTVTTLAPVLGAVVPPWPGGLCITTVPHIAPTTAHASTSLRFLDLSRKPRQVSLCSVV